MHSLRVLLLCLVPAALASGCTDRTLASIPIDPRGVEFLPFAVEVNRNLDILFVVDNSGSMENEQTSLSNNFRELITQIETAKYGRPNLHIGVVSTNAGLGPAGTQYGSSCSASGDGGMLQNAARVSGCTPPDGQFLIDIGTDDNQRQRNFQGELEQAFACIAMLGTKGCGFEQPLESMRLALSGEVPANQGFLRDDARLAVVLITDEDDCSASDPGLFNGGPPTDYRCFEHGVTCAIQPESGEVGTYEGCAPQQDSPYVRDVAEYVQFLRSLKKYPDRDILVAGIVGQSTDTVVVDEVTVRQDNEDIRVPKVKQSCFSGPEDNQGAYPPVRMQAFLKAFPFSYQATICQNDLAGALAEIGEFIGPPPEGACLPAAVADTDPAQTGMQPNCVITEIRDPNTDTHVERLLPRCSNSTEPTASTELPCYTMLPAPEACSGPDSLQIKAHYAPGVIVPPSTVVNAACER